MAHALVLRPATRLARRHPRRPAGAGIRRLPAFRGRGRVRDLSVPRAGGVGRAARHRLGRLPGRRRHGRCRPRGAHPARGTRRHRGEPRGSPPGACRIRCARPRRACPRFALRLPADDSGDHVGAGHGRSGDCTGHPQPLASCARPGNLHRRSPTARLPAGDLGGLAGGGRPYRGGRLGAGRFPDGRQLRGTARLLRDSNPGPGLRRGVPRPLQPAAAARQPAGRRRLRAADHRERGGPPGQVRARVLRAPRLRAQPVGGGGLGTIQVFRGRPPPPTGRTPCAENRVLPARRPAGRAAAALRAAHRRRDAGRLVLHPLAAVGQRRRTLALEPRRKGRRPRPRAAVGRPGSRPRRTRIGPDPWRRSNLDVHPLPGGP